NRTSAISADDLAALRAHGPVAADEFPDAIIEVPEYGYRPAVFEVVGSTMKELTVRGLAGPISEGVAADMAGPDERNFAVVLEGVGSAGQSGRTVWVATTTDGGATWNSRLVADGLGHAYRTRLVDAAGTYLVLTVDQFGTRTIYRQSASGDWLQIADRTAGGPISGATVDKSGMLVIIDDGCETGECGGTVRQDRYVPDQRRWLPAQTISISGDRAVAANVVHGAR